MRISRLITLISGGALCASLTLHGGEPSNCAPAGAGSGSPGTGSEPPAGFEKRRERLKTLPAPEREARRKELKTRLETRLSKLREKATNGTITIEEQRQLARGEQVLKRFDPSPASTK